MPAVDTTRMRLLAESAMNTRPSAASAVCIGAFRVALVAGPPSPVKLAAPAPAKRLIAWRHSSVAISGEVTDVQVPSTARVERNLGVVSGVAGEYTTLVAPAAAVAPTVVEPPEVVATSTWALSVALGLAHATVVEVAVSHEQVTEAFGGTVSVSTAPAAAVAALKAALATRVGTRIAAPATATATITTRAVPPIERPRLSVGTEPVDRPPSGGGSAASSSSSKSAMRRAWAASTAWSTVSASRSSAVGSWRPWWCRGAVSRSRASCQVSWARAGWSALSPAGSRRHTWVRPYQSTSAPPTPARAMRAHCEERARSSRPTPGTV